VPHPRDLAAGAPARLGKGDRLLLWGAVASGVATPWIVAVAVKLHLEASGEPTWPWSFVGRWIVLSLFLSPFHAAPFVALSIAAWLGATGRVRWLRDIAAWERRVLVAAGTASGVMGMVHVFLPVFRQFHPIVIVLLPLFVARYAASMAAGLGAAGAGAYLVRVARR